MKDYIVNMARQCRFEYPGGIYYIKSQGKNSEDIFRDESDCKRFLAILAETVFRFGWRCHSYCLLNDHYHLILETPYGNLSKGMRQVNGRYTQGFNRKYRRKGALFGDRFKSIIFEKGRYLLPLNRHLILNPVRSGLSHAPESWHWSSYLPTVKGEDSPSFLFTQAILSMFSRKNRAIAIERYKRFISSGEPDRFSWQDLKSQIFLGSDLFVEGMKRMFQMHKRSKHGKTISAEKSTRRSLEGVMPRSWISRKERDVRIYEAYVQHGYTLNEIAGHLGVHIATVSRAVRRTEKEIAYKALKKTIGGGMNG